jgi:hypothetical protein
MATNDRRDAHEHAPTADVSRSDSDFSSPSLDFAGNHEMAGVLNGAEVGSASGLTMAQMTCTAMGVDVQAATASNSVMRRVMASEEGLDLEAAQRDIAASSGQALPGAQRQRFERAFDHDFGHVRVHNDAPAQRAAEALNAFAFALGSDLYFGSGAFAPGTSTGERLLAHELTHVVQHDEGRLPSASSDGLSVSSPSDAHEREAYANERHIPRLISQLALDRSANELGASAFVAEARELDTARTPPDVLGTLRTMSAALGLGPNAVTVRTDEQAVSQVRALGTRGLAEGGTIKLDPSAFDARSADGRSLLAHELIHVAQDTLGSAAHTVDGSLAEAEAHTLGDALAAGHAVDSPVVGIPSGHTAAEGPGGGAAAAYAEFKGAMDAKKEIAASKKPTIDPSNRPSKPTQNREEKFSEYNTGLEGIADIIEDLGEFDALCDVISEDNTSQTRAELNKLRANEDYKRMCSMWQGAKDGEEDSGRMMSAFDSKFRDRGWLGSTEKTWNLVLRTAKMDAKRTAEAEAAAAERESAKSGELPKGVDKEAGEAGAAPQATKATGAATTGEGTAGTTASGPVPKEFPATPAYAQAQMRKGGVAESVSAEVGDFSARSDAMKGIASGGTGSRALAVFEASFDGFTSGFMGGASDGLKDGFITNTLTDFADQGLNKLAGGRLNKVPVAGAAMTLYQNGLLKGDFSGYMDAKGQAAEKITKGFSGGMDNFSKAMDASGMDAFGLVVAGIADWIGALADVLAMVSDILGTLAALCYIAGAVLILFGMALVWLAGVGAPLITAGGWVIRAGKLLDKVKGVIDPITAILKGSVLFLRMLAAMTVPDEAFADQLAAVESESQAYGSAKGSKVADTAVKDVKNEVVARQNKKREDKATAEKAKQDAAAQQGDQAMKKKDAELKQIAEQGDAALQQQKPKKPGDEGAVSKDQLGAIKTDTQNDKEKAANANNERMKFGAEAQDGKPKPTNTQRALNSFKKNLRSSFDPTTNFKSLKKGWSDLSTELNKWSTKDGRNLLQYEATYNLNDLKDRKGKVHEMVNRDREKRALEHLSELKTASQDKMLQAHAKLKTQMDSLETLKKQRDTINEQPSGADFQTRLVLSQTNRQIEATQKALSDSQSSLKNLVSSYETLKSTQDKAYKAMKERDQKYVEDPVYRAQKTQTLADENKSSEAAKQTAIRKVEAAKKHQESMFEQYLTATGKVHSQDPKQDRKVSTEPSVDDSKIAIRLAEIRVANAQKNLKGAEQVKTNATNHHEETTDANAKFSDNVADHQHEQNAKEVPKLQQAFDAQTAAFDSYARVVGKRHPEDTRDASQIKLGNKRPDNGLTEFMHKQYDRHVQAAMGKAKTSQNELDAMNTHAKTTSDKHNTTVEQLAQQNEANKPPAPPPFWEQVLEQPSGGKDIGHRVLTPLIKALPKLLATPAKSSPKKDNQASDNKASEQGAKASDGNAVQAAATPEPYGLDENMLKDKATRDKEAGQGKSSTNVAASWYGDLGKNVKESTLGVLGGPSGASLLKDAPPHSLTALADIYQEADSAFGEFAEHHANAYVASKGTEVADASIAETQALADHGTNVVAQHANAVQSNVADGEQTAADRQSQMSGNPIEAPKEDKESGSLITQVFAKLTDNQDRMNDAPTEGADSGNVAAGGTGTVAEGADASKEMLTGGAVQQQQMLGTLKSGAQTTEADATSASEELKGKAMSETEMRNQIEGYKTNELAQRDTALQTVESKSEEYSASLDDMVIWAQGYRGKREAFEKAGGKPVAVPPTTES